LLGMRGMFLQENIQENTIIPTLLLVSSWRSIISQWCIIACRCSWKVRERRILKVSSSRLQSGAMQSYSILLQNLFLNFGKRITACLPTV
jgi:hypothetical protein